MIINIKEAILKNVKEYIQERIIELQEQGAVEHRKEIFELSLVLYMLP